MKVMVPALILLTLLLLDTKPYGHNEMNISEVREIPAMGEYSPIKIAFKGK